MLGEFLYCRWSCAHCKESGSVRPWKSESETPSAAIERHARNTKGVCVSGCLYQARAVAAVDPDATDTGKPSTREAKGAE